MKETNRKIVVLAGGESGERNVSLDSARAIAKTLRQSGHSVSIIDALNGTTLDEAFIDTADSFASAEYIAPAKAEPDTRALVKALLRERDAGCTVVFNGLHGGIGENGVIPALLECLGLAYTGSPMSASAMAMNKDIAKRVMWSLNIPTPKWHVFRKDVQKKQEIIATIRDEFLFPVIIKPVDCGSTVGLSLVETEDILDGAVEKAFTVSGLIMAEIYFTGREVTIAVLNGEALPPVEIKPTHAIYDYTCKYTKGKSEYICPAPVDDAILAKLSQDAVRLYKALGCRGYARVDFIVSDEGHYICLELNTLPGMTELSLFPMAASAAGMTFPQLLDRLCQLALGDSL